MRLLFDENLSSSLIGLLANLFPDSAHIGQLLSEGAQDSAGCEVATSKDYVIVSKDNDFRQRSFLEGAPPKVIWFSVGNAGTSTIAALLRERHVDLIQFLDDASVSLLVVEQPKSPVF